MRFFDKLAIANGVVSVAAITYQLVRPSYTVLAVQSALCAAIVVLAVSQALRHASRVPSSEE